MQDKLLRSGGALDQLAATQPHLLIVNTLGSDGVRAARGTDRRFVPAFGVARFVDATGAGDACAAGFLAQLLRDPLDVAAALRSGAAAGALWVSTAGACERPITSTQLAAVLATGSVE